MHRFDELVDLAREMFPERKRDRETSRILMSLLLEESGELAGACRSYYGRTYRPELAAGDIQDVMGEIGDVMVVLCGICECYGIRPDDCFDMTIAKLKKRFEAKKWAEANPCPECASGGHTSIGQENNDN